MAILASLLPARAQGRVEALQVIRTGFFQMRDVSRIKSAPGTAVGAVADVEGVSWFTNAPAVTAQVGTSFGARFVVLGGPPGARVTLRSVFKIPEPGITNPRTRNTFRTSASDFTTRIGARELRGYTFGEQWEVLPGVWTLEVWQGDRKLLEQNFTIQ